MQTVEQAGLADELGYGCWWQVEHHGAEEFSLSSAPELLLAAFSQRTERIRLGHAAVLAPGAINHPIRVAERTATLDHLSGGRVEVGLTRSTAPEWRLFGVDAATVRAQVQDAFEQVPKLWSDENRVNGTVPVLPKPYQRPHPPLWQPASTPASFEEAGRRGVGVLGTTLWEPLDRVARLVELYRAAIARCEQPVGSFVNNQVGFFTFVHCAETDEEAMRGGAAAAAAWYTARALSFFEAADAFMENLTFQQKLMDDPSGGGLAGQFLREDAAAADGPNRAQIAVGRILQGEQIPDEELFEALNEQDSLIVGSPETCRKKLRAYADIGIDRLMCFHRVGGIPHDRVMRNISLIGDLISEFDQD
ncbi:alkanesulfonate monooxygenase SsuD/methylene tetrahydromethanopterin reductase-like flavin-dependent oxidoreductase (luciferase family) [Streptomyces sp. 846.5]|nr:LLM class flavin-dependent oxidoreductase [Streptomyces sp. 846.5]TDU02091.1 alkanesulfonate monooxygenase SsuD/methylene tetrahydromethanopterin reductase-like flavin-dependent oxidoreductase (luciferase family) [Streptomyces sp. 846.5]